MSMYYDVDGVYLSVENLLLMVATCDGLCILLVLWNLCLCDALFDVNVISHSSLTIFLDYLL